MVCFKMMSNIWMKYNVMWFTHYKMIKMVQQASYVFCNISCREDILIHTSNKFLSNIGFSYCLCPCPYIGRIRQPYSTKFHTFLAVKFVFFSFLGLSPFAFLFNLLNIYF